MKTSISNLNGEQQNVLNHLSKNLKTALRPLMIICYGHRSETAFKSSAFLNTGMEKKNSSAFDLVIIVKNNEVLPDSSLYEIAKRNCSPVSDDHIIIFRVEAVLLGLQLKQRFFASIFRKGILVYANKEALHALPNPLPASCFITNSEKERLFMLKRHAQKYLTEVKRGLDKISADPYLMLLQLNESAVYILKYFILANCGLEIREDLRRTFNFSNNISDALVKVFPCNTIEEKLLFHMMDLSFIDEGFCPGSEVIRILCKRITRMLTISERISKIKMADLLPAENEKYLKI